MRYYRGRDLAELRRDLVEQRMRSRQAKDDLAECLERLSVNAATVLGLIPASFDTV